MATYTTYMEKSDLPIGRSIWAYAFTTNSHENGALLKQEPVFGEITMHRNRKMFAPYRKDGTGLVMSKAVSKSARDYADTLEEAIEGYNKRIDEQIKWHNARIEELQKGKLPVLPKRKED